MAVNAVIIGRLSLTTLGAYVVFPVFGVTKCAVQVTRLGTGANITTTFGVTYSHDGANFIEYATPKTVSLSAPTGAYNVSPIQIGCTEPFAINAQYLCVYVKANAASGDEAEIEVLSVDESTPGESVVQQIVSSGGKMLVSYGTQITSPNQIGGGIDPGA